MTLHQQHSFSSLSPALSSSSLPHFDMSYKEKTAYMQDDCSDISVNPSRPSSLSSLSSLSLSAAAAAAAVSSPSSKSQSDHKADTKKSAPSSPSSYSSSLSSSALCSGAEEEEHRYSLFLSWLRGNGAKFPHLTLRRYAADYRGVHISSRAEIAKGKTLLRIPHRLLITVELAKASPLGGLVASLPNIGSQAILAVYLLQERQRGSASFWKPWLDVLPAAFSTLPMFFSPLELQELQGCSELLSKVRAQQKSMRDEYAAIQRLPGIASYHHFSYDEFVWAALAVGTRVFSLCINNSKTSVLAPLADMMNHKNPAGSSWSYCNRKEAFTLTACCGMADGEAVYESYGIKDNKRFFASYGFCLEENAANEVSVLIKGEMMADERQSGGATGGLSSLSSSRAFTVRQAYDAAMEEMMAFLRCVNAYDHHMDDCNSSSNASAAAAALCPPSSSSSAAPPTSSSLSSSSSAFVSYPRASFTIPLSVDNELSALYALRCACKEHLSAYPSKLEQDVQLLASLSSAGSSSDCTNYRNILVFRIGEKRIYRWLIDFSSLGIALLCMPWEEARVRIRQMMDSAGAEDDAYAGMMGYVTAVVAPLLQERSKQSRRAMQSAAQSSSAGKGRAGVTGRRLSQDAERPRLHGGLKPLGMSDYSSRDMDEDDDDDDDEEDEDEDDGSEKDMTAEAESPSSSSSTSLHSAFGSDDSGSQSVSPLTSLAVSLMSAPAASKRASLPPVSSSPPAVSRSSSIISTPLPFTSSALSPSPSPPSTFSSRHLPRSAGSSSSRSAAPRILPAMPPVSRSSSHAASLSSSTGAGSHSSSSNAPLAAPIPKLPSMRTSPTIAANSSSTQRQAAAAPAAGAANRQQRGTAASASAAASAGSKQTLSPSSAAASPSSAGTRGGVLVTAPSPTPSTSDDSQDEQSTPVDADDSDDGEDTRELGRGDKVPAMATVDSRRRMHCAQ